MSGLTASQQELVRAATGLVRGLAGRLAPRWPEIGYEELVCAGNEALVQAALRYDPNRGCAFESYAFFQVRGNMVKAAARELCSSERLVLKMAARALANAAPPPAATPSFDEPLQDAPDKARDRAVRWTSATAASMLVAMVLAATSYGGEDALIDREQYALGLTRLGQALESLEQNEQRFVELHYRQGLTLNQIGDRFGASARTVARLHERIKRKLARRLRASGVDRAPPLEGRPAR